MRLTLHAVGRRMPDWIVAGGDEYARRLPAHWKFRLREHAQARGDDGPTRGRKEAATLLGALDPKSHVVALDERGKVRDTAGVALRLAFWQGLGKPVELLIGGPDGLDETVRRRADETWSLSPLTFPHPLVRVLVLEQLYRADSLAAGHPYHRA